MRVSSAGTALFSTLVKANTQWFCSSAFWGISTIFDYHEKLFDSLERSIVRGSYLFVVDGFLVRNFYSRIHVSAPSVTESSEIERTEFIYVENAFSMYKHIPSERWTILFFDFHIHFLFLLLRPFTV